METILCDCNEKTHLGTWGHRWRLAAPDSQAVPVWRHQTRIVHLLLPSHQPSPRHLEVGHGVRLPQRRHTVHTGLFKHVLPADFVCAGAVLLRGCVWLCERGAPSLRCLGVCSTGLSAARGLQDVPASVTAAHRLTCSLARGVPQDHRLNPCLLHWLADSSPPGKPHIGVLYTTIYS